MATTFGGSVVQGAVTTGASGFAGGFVGSAGNAWANGSSFNQGLSSGWRAGKYGAMTGAIIGGVQGGINFSKRMSLFYKGNKKLGIRASDPVDPTDDFLSEARQVWYPEAPRNNVFDFSTENVPPAVQASLDARGAAARTIPRQYLGELTGYSDVYFNKNLAFNSARDLYFIMGHEFVHVSQISLLAGESARIMSSAFLELMEYHAYSYGTFLGSSNAGGFTRADVLSLMQQFPDHFNRFNWINFSWTRNTNFVYPLR